jgi:betaine-aldehyde dehydrogenase
LNSKSTVPMNARHWIGGAWIGSAKTGVSISPSTSETLGTFADGGRAEAEAAIAAARRAFDTTSWSRDRKLRATALSELADRLIERAASIARTLARECGKVITQATMEATLTPQTLRHNAGLALAQIGGAAARQRPHHT